MLSLALFVVLSQAELSPPPPPPVSEPPSAGYGVTVDPQRSASLIAPELEKLEKELQRYKPKPAWLPVTLGVVVGLALAGLTAWLVIDSPRGFNALGHIVLAFSSSVIGLAAIIAGVVVTTVFARINSRNESRAAAVQRRIDELKAQPQGSVPAPWRSGLADVTPLTPVFTF